MNGDPGTPEYHYDRACAERTAGRLDLAHESFSKALAIDSTFSRAALGLGQTLYDLGRPSDALQYLEQAVQAEPDNAMALRSCGQALADAGHVALALEFLRRAIEAAPRDVGHRLAAIDVLQAVEFTAPHAWYEQFLIDCLDDPLLPHDKVTNAAASLLRVKPAIGDALAADRLGTADLARLAKEPLLVRLLRKTIGRSWALEQFVVRLRSTLAQRGDADHVPLMAAVAEQAFNAGYVQYQSPAEAALEQKLIARDAEALTPFELMTLAAYRPLADVPGAEAIADRSDLDGAARRVIRRTLSEPLVERRIQRQIVALTPIRDDVSRRVQAQYEEAPYPRWSNTPSVADRSGRLVDEIERHSLRFENPGWPDRPNVLVPGCGTGYHPLLLARMHAETNVLAVDLSRASLAYAIRRQRELGVGNVRFCQGDLLGLGELDERFDYIDCAGVLHHMASPIDGWRVLSELLEPGGVMRIGLYSELARRTIVAARAKIAALGIPDTPSAIREFRVAIMNDPALSALRGLAATTADFYSMGGIRDLIFHVQEHRFDLPAIGRALATLGLEFGGFLLHDRDVVRRFHQLYPATEQWLDLDCWAGFEAQHPDTFYRMYQFYCLKRGRAGADSSG